MQDERPYDPTEDQGPASGIYFIECAGYIKIGMSCDVRPRLRSIRSGCPLEMTVIGFVHRATFTECVNLESELHLQFKPLHHRAEWFRDDESIRNYLESHGSPWPK